MISTVIAEKYSLIRAALKRLLLDFPGIVVLGEASDGKQAIAIVELLKPDILLLDLDLRRVQGIDVIRRIHSSKARTRCIVVTGHPETSLVSEALRAGAAGYLLKSDYPSDLREAIQVVLDGGEFVSPRLKNRVLSLTLGKISQPDDPFLALTRQERLVFELSAKGLSSQSIAVELFLSFRTVESHRANFMRKLDLKTQTDLVRLAIRRGTIFV